MTKILQSTGSEYLDEDGTCKCVQMIGSLRSLAWLAGLDELVEAIDSSAYTIEDSIEIVPLGAGLMWPVERHIDQGKIPSQIARKVYGHWVSPQTPHDTATVHGTSPQSSPQQKPPRDIYGLKWALVVMSILPCVFLFALDNTIVGDFQPTIIKEFHDLAMRSRLSVAVLLGAASMLLVWCKGYDQFNGKWLHITCTAIFWFKQM
ncbi:uncharacterized protein N7459_001376 [Penicillium hispanicum]|uniref:uncharacterized protein n=1 Tax=Penicillium hispanicum TaxID=1080232 RepID=UPI00253FDD77|nr:uncharacterized protein N7459_001376 [Penicillium hispanicum]KAJ5595168.1 hypothetical protein N7459_001376 [Penicillium hispanicum]